LNGETYWGRVLPELQAVETYEESVEANKSAVLVLRMDDGYNIQMNVEGGAAATLTIFVEGLLTRKSGLYTLDLPVGRAGIEDTKFSLDLEVRSNFEPVAGYSVRGLPSLQVTDLANGIRLQYPTTQLTIEELIEITYTLDRQMGGAQLLTYNNGSDNFFVYLLAPCIVEDVETARRQFVFVLDESGSMSGTKIDQAKTAFSTMIGGLRSIDTFNVISFNDNIRTLWDEPHSGATEYIQAAQD
jgi:Ca-activated chloride channel family protein